MPVKRKDKENNNTPVQKKKLKQEKIGDFSDDENLSDIDDDGEIFHGIRIPAELPPIMSAEDKRGPRMVIKNIIINNFKSYYGKIIIGPFHKSLSSIVGANGSGKSNVIDSLLFVFGYRSTKIRSKKVSVLLHKSDRHKDVQQCSVTVNFMHINDDETHEMGFVVIPGTEISITRTAFKDNSSFYTLNNKRVKFKDIATILKKNGIDLIHNRFLILQGEVEQIAMMKPKAENEHSTGMLEYLEDVIGTARYKKPILKLEEKVKEITMEKNEKVTRLKFISKQREELLNPVEEIIRCLKLKNKMSRLLNKLFQVEIYQINKKLEKETENSNKMKSRLNTINTKYLEFENIKKVNLNILKGFQDEIDTSEKKRNILRNEQRNLKNNENKLEYDISSANDMIKKCENSIKQEKNKATKAEKVPKIKEAECERLKSELASLEELYKELDANYAKIFSESSVISKPLTDERELLISEASNLQNLAGIKNNEFESLKTELELLLYNEKNAEEKLSRLEEQMIKGLDDFQVNTRKKENAEGEILKSKNAIRNLEKNIEDMKNNEQKLDAELKHIRMNLGEKRTAYAETTERSRPIQFALDLKDKGIIPGLLGRCGDHGQVESKFDIPSCTACTSTDQIVVETSEAAHACIKKLRESNIGRLTFSILPQVQKLKSYADMKKNYPENSMRVFDVIKILDQRFRLTFYAGLYDTLIAENLEQARRIAFGTNTRYRVVTFKGDLIDQSGIMSGGGRPIKGKIGPQEIKSRHAGCNTSQVSEREVEKLEKHCQCLEDEINNIKSNRIGLESEIRQHNLNIDANNIIVKQCLSRINVFKEKESQLKGLIEAQKLEVNKQKTDQIAVNNKKKEIEKAEKELEEANKNYTKVASKVDELNNKIKEMIDGPRRKAKSSIDETTNALEKVKSDLYQANKDIEAAERQVKKSENEITSLNVKINDSKEEIISCKVKLQECIKLQAAIEKKIVVCTENVTKNKELILDLHRTEENLRNQNFSLDKEKADLIIKLKDSDEIIQTLTEKVDGKKEKLSSLVLHKIPEIDDTQRDPVKDFATINLNKENNNKPPLENGDVQKENGEVQKENGEVQKENGEVQEENGKVQEENGEVQEENGKVQEENGEVQEENGEIQEENGEIQEENGEIREENSGCQVADNKSPEKNDHINNNAFSDENEQLIKYPEEQLPLIVVNKLHLEISSITEMANKKINREILEEYEKRSKQYNEKAIEVSQVLKLYNDFGSMINKVRQRRRDEFMASFKKITIKLKEMYQMITLGGDAELELVDSLDPFSEGVNFSVRPPKKTWKVISNLSGGEKTLSSLALVFALHYYKPSPLYVMDEIDAALDFKNVSIIAYYIKERTKNSQFVIISLRSNMFEKANLLIGIYKTSDCTETAAVQTDHYQKVLDKALAENANQTSHV